MRKLLFISTLMFAFTLTACKHNSNTSIKDGVQTPVVVNNKKVAVVNNTDQHYANLATVPDMCIKCIIGAVEQTTEFKNLGIPAVNKVKYEINWVPAPTAQNTISGRGATNAIRLDIMDNKGNKKAYPAFVYDNTSAKMYLLKSGVKTEIKTTTSALVKIRRVCYWGVASAK